MRSYRSEVGQGHTGGWCEVGSYRSGGIILELGGGGGGELLNRAPSNYRSLESILNQHIL